jgi:hypothetical protein
VTFMHRRMGEFINGAMTAGIGARLEAPGSSRLRRKPRWRRWECHPDGASRPPDMEQYIGPQPLKGSEARRQSLATVGCQTPVSRPNGRRWLR